MSKGWMVRSQRQYPRLIVLKAFRWMSQLRPQHLASNDKLMGNLGGFGHLQHLDQALRDITGLEPHWQANSFLEVDGITIHRLEDPPSRLGRRVLSQQNRNIHTSPPNARISTTGYHRSYELVGMIYA